MAERFDHEKAYKQYVHTQKTRTRRRLIEAGMTTKTRDLAKYAPKPQPLLTEEEWDTLHMRAEVEALANATSDAERLIITQRLQRQYGEKVKKMIKK